MANPKDREDMEDLWKVPRGRISPKPGHHTMSLFHAMGRGDVTCCLVMCTNPGQTLPNVTAYREGMEKAFLVVVDAFHPTGTTRFADVVLPAALWVEKEGVKGNAERRYHLYPKLVDPPGEARSDRRRTDRPRQGDRGITMETDRPTIQRQPSAWVQRELTLAVHFAIAGLLCVLLFLWYGFGAWSMGLGTFIGIPLLGLAILLYLGAVAADLKKRGAL